MPIHLSFYFTIEAAILGRNLTSFSIYLLIEAEDACYAQIRWSEFDYSV